MVGARAGQSCLAEAPVRPSLLRDSHWLGLSQDWVADSSSYCLPPSFSPTHQLLLPCILHRCFFLYTSHTCFPEDLNGHRDRPGYFPHFTTMKQQDAERLNNPPGPWASVKEQGFRLRLPGSRVHGLTHQAASVALLHVNQNGLTFC